MTESAKKVICERDTICQKNVYNTKGVSFL